MNNGKKIFAAVLIDLVLLAALITSCYVLIFREVSDEVGKILTFGVIIIIPAMFYVSYTTFAGNKFNYNESAYEREFGQEHDEEADAENDATHISEEQQ